MMHTVDGRVLHQVAERDRAWRRGTKREFDAARPLQNVGAIFVEGFAPGVAMERLRPLFVRVLMAFRAARGGEEFGARNQLAVLCACVGRAEEINGDGRRSPRTDGRALVASASVRRATARQHGDDGDDGCDEAERQITVRLRHDEETLLRCAKVFLSER